MGSKIGFVRPTALAALVLTVFATAFSPLRAIEPVDPELGPEARKVLDFTKIDVGWFW